MTVKSSLDLKETIKPCTNKFCKACGLYLHQQPACEKAASSHVFWVGLSAVLFEEGVVPRPLSPLTPSGSLIDRIEESLRKDIQFYKTNIVKCVPLSKEKRKIRYPLEHEMEKCFPNFESELKVLTPKVVFLLGKQTASFVMKKLGIKNFSLADDFKYSSFRIGGVQFIPIHHPSYILVYKRKELDLYIEQIQALCKHFVSIKKPSKAKTKRNVLTA